MTGDNLVIESRLRNAVELRLHEMVEGDLGKTARRVGGAVVLRPGFNDVDAGFWGAWKKQNEGTLLAAHFAAVEERAPPRPM